MNVEQLRTEAGRYIEAALASSDEVEKEKLLELGLELREQAERLEELYGERARVPCVTARLKILMTRLSILIGKLNILRLLFCLAVSPDLFYLA